MDRHRWMTGRAPGGGPQRKALAVEGKTHLHDCLGAGRHHRHTWVHVEKHCQEPPEMSCLEGPA